ncbi:MAG: transporter substrate-binding domain-containing protein [Bacteroidales bacterium]|nr:transporter substrate-binding domain-containing protein [Bacteroidales bacterium]
MKKGSVSYIILIILCAVCGILLFHKYGDRRNTHVSIEAPVENSHDTIHALLFYHASDYFVYRGSPIGFQYDMLKQMAKDMDKNIQITVESDPENAFFSCYANDFDLVAMDVNKSQIFAQYLNFSEPHSYSYPVLISQKKTKISDTSTNELHIPAQFPVDVTLVDIDHKAKWKLVYSEHQNTEDLFELLAEKKIDFIASDYNLAVTLLPFYPNLKIVGRIGSDFNREWVLNPNNPILNDSINNWIDHFKRTKQYASLCQRYHSTNSHVIQNSFGKSNRGSISEYDAIIKKYCKPYNLDWRFVSSIIFQETKFNTDLVGVGGSFGIMQLMPETALNYGITDTSSVDEQIRGGIKHIYSLYKKYLGIKNEEDRLYVTAAAYNAGSGHLQDAMALCTKYEKDSVDSWRNIFKYLSLKSQKEYYNDPVVRCGYYPGNHSIKYAKEVMARYDAYRIQYK